MSTTNYAYTGYQVSFTRKDVSDVYGEGKFFLEEVMAAFMASLAGGNIVVSGFALGAPASLNIDIDPGVGIVSGYYAYGKDTLTLAMPDNTTNYIWLSLSRVVGGADNGKVYEVTVTRTNSTTPPTADSMLMWRIVAASGSITATSDFRRPRIGSTIVIEATGDSQVVVPVGCFYAEVELLGAGAGASGDFGGGGGGGGGGGAYVRAIYPVVPGTLTVHVGVAGSGGSPGNNGTSGESTWFDVNTQKANGGTAGTNPGVGGAGGATYTTDFNVVEMIAGDNGHNKVTTTGGSGGNSPAGIFKGLGGAGGAGGNNGAPGTGFGSGGGGGGNGNSGAGGKGGWMKIRF